VEYNFDSIVDHPGGKAHVIIEGQGTKCVSVQRGDTLGDLVLLVATFLDRQLAFVGGEEQSVEDKFEFVSFDRETETLRVRRKA